MALTEAEELELLELEEQEASARGSAPAAAPGAPRASQRDVRASEPPHTLAAQEADERGFNAALKAWLKTQTGQYYAGPEARAQFSKITGRPDPMVNRERAELQHAEETGDVVYGTGPTYNVAKPLASMAGFAAGGPAGATGAEFLVRLAALGNNLDKAVKAGAIDEDRAAEILAGEMLKGTATDAAWNFGVPLAMQLAKKIPGATWLGEKLDTAMKRVAARMGIQPGAPKPSLRDSKIEARVKETTDPARQQAVRELSKRVTDDYIPTPGQVSGKPSMAEQASNKTFPTQFEGQEAALTGAAERMRRETLYPTDQPAAQQLGQRVVTLADETAQAVKDRLRPTFQAADDLGVRVDFSAVEKAAREALEQAERVPGNAPQQVKEAEALRKLVRWFETRAKRDGAAPLHELKAELERLKASRASALQDWGRFKTFEARQNVLSDNFYPVPGLPRVPGKYSPHPERAAEGAAAAREADDVARRRFAEAQSLTPRIAELEEQIGALEGRPLLRAADALDFIKDQKSILRASPDWQPSTRFEALVNQFITKADDAFSAAATKSGNGDLVRNLGIARTEYRRMMETVYDDAIKQALRKEGGGSPEDIGQFLWQNGKVSRIEQLDDLLKLANREGTLTRQGAEQMRRDVTRGFLQEAVKDVPSAAKWSERLAADPRLSRTWDVLTSGAGGQQLRDTMRVLEQAAQVATSRDSKQVARLPFGVVLGRAAQGGLGVSLVTGAFHPAMAAGGIAIASLMKAMATAYTHGDKGALNTIAKVVRLRDAATPGTIQALRAALDDLQAVGKKYGVDFAGSEEEQPAEGQE